MEAACMFGVFALIFVSVVFLARHQAAQRLALLKAVASNFPGMRVEEGGWFSGTRLLQSAPGWSAVVSFFAGSKNSPPYSRVDLSLSRAMPALKLTPQGLLSGVAKFFGAQDVQIGVPDFDAAYMIAARPHEFARTFLDGGSRTLVNELAGMSNGRTFLVEIAGKDAHVRIGRYLRDAGEIERFLRKSFEFAATLAGTTSTDVQVIETASEGKGLCQVCGSALEEDVVRCRKCGTPHHRDCWSYNGCCSTFGCGERRCVG